MLIVEESVSELEGEEKGVEEEESVEAGDSHAEERVLEVGSGVHVFDRAWREDTDWPPMVETHPYMSDKERVGEANYENVIKTFNKISIIAMISMANLTMRRLILG